MCVRAMLKSNNKMMAKAEDYGDGKQIVCWCRRKNEKRISAGVITIARLIM